MVYESFQWWSTYDDSLFLFFCLSLDKRGAIFTKEREREREREEMNAGSRKKYPQSFCDKRKVETRHVLGQRLLRKKERRDRIDLCGAKQKRQSVILFVQLLRKIERLNLGKVVVIL